MISQLPGYCLKSCIILLSSIACISLSCIHNNVVHVHVHYSRWMDAARPENFMEKTTCVAFTDAWLSNLEICNKVVPERFPDIKYYIIYMYTV